MIATKPTKDAYRLLHDGSLALAEVSATGMPIDVRYVYKTIDKVKKEMVKMERRLKQDRHWEKWLARFGRKSKLLSTDQLRVVLYEVMDYEAPEDKTAKDKDQADANALKSIGVPFTDLYLQYKYRDKVLAVLTNIREHLLGNRVHPSFNLNIVSSYRSSCTEPNLQNVPVRIPYHKKMIREAFVPHPDYHIVEIDYSGVEVSVAACYHEDPMMLEYLLNPDKDMHRDMAAQIFMTPEDTVSSLLRYYGKNGFVFPEFYGSYYIDRAKQIWKDAVLNPDLEIEGRSVRNHLKAKGIRKRGACNPKEKPKPHTFEKYIKEVEEHFWGVRFQRYTEWKTEVYEKYQSDGYIGSHTGFIYSGLMSRNQVINYPVQGSAFHCLLWSLIRIVRRLRKHKFRSRIIGQIHDSIIAEVHKSELEDYLHLAHQIMTVEISKKWDWLIVPLSVEAEVSPLGESWYKKEEYDLAV